MGDLTASSITTRTAMRGGQFGAWSRQDRLHRFLSRGIEVAQGRCTWAGALEQFSQYTDYILGEQQ